MIKGVGAAGRGYLGIASLHAGAWLSALEWSAEQCQGQLRRRRVQDLGFIEKPQQRECRGDRWEWDRGGTGRGGRGGAGRAGRGVAGAVTIA